MRLARRDHRRAFFHRAVVERVDGQAMPVDDVGIGGRIGHVDGDGHALAQAQQRARDLAVIGKRLHG